LRNVYARSSILRKRMEVASIVHKGVSIKMENANAFLTITPKTILASNARKPKMTPTVSELILMNSDSIV
jgi:hypothetical protein